MTDIFVSHAAANKDLADKLIAFLKEAVGVPTDSIFCSSVGGHHIPLADDFSEYMKQQIKQPKLVILLMTPSYMESWFCLMELGATWAISHKALPIVVPPTNIDVVSKTLGLKQGWSIVDDEGLISLRQLIRNTDIELEPRNEHDWEKKRKVWKADLRRLLNKLPDATNVSAKEYEKLKAIIATQKKDLEELQDAYDEACETIEDLKAAKDPVSVKTILAKRNNFDPEARFKELLSNISGQQPQISRAFYIDLIMHRYGKVASINWYDLDEKHDAQLAIQYNLIDIDPPHECSWEKNPMKRVASSIKELENFLESEEAEEFLRAKDLDGAIMDLDNRRFWEDYL